MPTVDTRLRTGGKAPSGSEEEWLRAVAAPVLKIQEPGKFTLGQRITVLISDAVSTVLEVKGGHWLSPPGLPEIPGHPGTAG